MQKSYLVVRRGPGWIPTDDIEPRNKPPKMRTHGKRGRKTKEKK